ncbi:MAG TPA: alpha/beta hydrolase domain-containing protein [Vicinamibacteria bacterium]|nr:alpha/beta hydrolase domain-containing protein [Vicinamibacteria bacterium]
MRKIIGRAILVLGLLSSASKSSHARVLGLRVEVRETVLSGRPFGLAGPYEKLSGTVELALDPDQPANARIVDLALGQRDANGDVRFSADFYLLKPIDAARGNGVLFYEAGNRGRKRILTTFQKATPSDDPATEEELGDGTLMEQGFSLLWMGWQWDVPEGRMRMDMPIATSSGEPIQGLVRGNFILGVRSETAPLADRGHRAYGVVDPDDPEHRMTVKRHPFGPAEEIPRNRWRFVDSQTVALEEGFEPGLIYDVVYRTEDPRIVGTGLAGTRDLVSFIKYDRGESNPLPGIRYAIGWGVSQTGRFLRHFVYEGFNADEKGRMVFDGLIDQVGGAGRGSFNHRFGQASRDALQHFNILYPVDMFPFTDGPSIDPVTGQEEGLLEAAEKSRTVPKFFHILTSSEYFNRGGSLTHTDPDGTRDADIPSTSRIYFIASAPHIVGPFPPEPNPDVSFLGRAPMNPLRYDAVIRALFNALTRWVVEDVPPPPSAYPRFSDGTLAPPERAGWPNVPGFEIPKEPLTPHRLDFGPRWREGIVSFEPPHVLEPFAVRVPAVDDAGNDRAGIRLPEVAVPLATMTGWNYRHPKIGAPGRLSSEIGSYIALPRTRAEKLTSADSRPSLEELYPSRDDYLGKVTRAALELVEARYVLASDLPELVRGAAEHYDRATAPLR